MGGSSSKTAFRINQLDGCDTKTQKVKVVTVSWYEEFDDSTYEQHVKDYCAARILKSHKKFKKISNNIFAKPGKDGEAVVDVTKKHHFYVMVVTAIFSFLSYKIQVSGTEDGQQYGLGHPEIRPLKNLEDIYSAVPCLAEIFAKFQQDFIAEDIQDTSLLTNMPWAEKKFKFVCARRTVSTRVVGQRQLTKNGSMDLSGSGGPMSAITGSLNLGAQKESTRDIEVTEYGDWSCHTHTTNFDHVEQIECNFEIYQSLFNQLAEHRKHQVSLNF